MVKNQKLDLAVSAMEDCAKLYSKYTKEINKLSEDTQNKLYKNYKKARKFNPRQTTKELQED